jgi:hypothetical protein
MSDGDEQRSAEVDRILADYQLDFKLAKWLELGRFLRTQLLNPLAGLMFPSYRKFLGPVVVKGGCLTYSQRKRGVSHANKQHQHRLMNTSTNQVIAYDDSHLYSSE